MNKENETTNNSKPMAYDTLLGVVVENPYKVDISTIKTGDTFFVFFDDGFYEILIGSGVSLDYMFVDFPNKKRVRITTDELYTKVPDNWKGYVKRLNYA